MNTSRDSVAAAKSAASLAGTILKKAPKIRGSTSKEAIAQALLENITALSERFRKAKTFIYSSEAEDLYNFYVPTTIVAPNGARIKRAGFATATEINRRLVITGTGGSGKTILIRHLFLEALFSGSTLPVHLELRRLSDTDSSIIEVALEKLASIDQCCGAQISGACMDNGLVTLFLDGYDELKSAQQKKLEDELCSLPPSGPAVILTSRPDQTLKSWPNHSISQIAPLSIEDAKELIAKLNFNTDAKERFLQRLEADLFQTHTSFLSNPLLLSIMLLTYTESGEIPNRLSTFYTLAFETLFYKHDALKQGFQRERRTKLDVLQFGRVFSAFSAASYKSTKVRFSTTDAVTFATSAVALTGNTGTSPGDFLEDAKRAVCLLIEDGLDITFVHRSFQEYFTARFIIDTEDTKRKRMIESLCFDNPLKMRTDAVIEMLHEMDPIASYKHYLIPELERIFPGSKANRKVSPTFWPKTMQSMFSSFHVEHPSQASEPSLPRKAWYTSKERTNSRKSYALGNAHKWAHEILPRNLQLDDGPVSVSDYCKEFSIDKSFELAVSGATLSDPRVKRLSELEGWLSLLALEQARVLLLHLRAALDKHDSTIEEMFGV